ncbi:MAG: hypothetical protein QM709_03760 [Spongiibacteraceae bacterium]
MKSTNLSKLSLATAAAALFSAAVVPAVHAAEGGSASVKCSGINACKGQSKCATAENACAGQNSCKGHGWLPVPSEKDCTAKGGKVVK